jgi:hypothetical protein
VSRQEARIPVIRNILKKRKTGRLESAGFTFGKQKGERPAPENAPDGTAARQIRKNVEQRMEKLFSKKEKWCMIRHNVTLKGGE